MPDVSPAMVTLFCSQVLTEFIVKEIAISYIRTPKQINLEQNQTCELSEETHAEIVRDAVNLLLENFEANAQRIQTSNAVEQTNE